jgi:hypothetical protein
MSRPSNARFAEIYHACPRGIVNMIIDNYIDNDKGRFYAWK